MVGGPQRIGVWDPFQMTFLRFLRLINGGDPNYLLTGMVLQVMQSFANKESDPSTCRRFFFVVKT